MPESSAANEQEVEGMVPSQWWLDLKVKNQQLRKENKELREALEVLLNGD